MVMKRTDADRGFTLLEMVIVLTIISMLATASRELF
jgi:prepilin-type N-terminal cleavage/methylation domain-containing protein